MPNPAPFDTVRTRFAPSPTGYLHIGGARTALFNYLLAKRLGGKFILRIEDTDQTRNIEAADAKLVEDMRWLGLHWDEGPEVSGPAGEYHQSRRLKNYQQVARQLLDAGNAYYAFDTREELDAMRKEAEKAKRRFRYPRPAAFPSDADADAARAAGRPVVVRLKMPDHDFEVQDQIVGAVRIAASEVDDFVILKGDGWPTYHFAVVVDDEDMQVTHVLRGQEHLMNTPNHMGLQELLGYHTPTYAHLPVILNMDGSKMSKREKDAAVRAAAEAALAAKKYDEAGLRDIAGVSDTALFDAWRRKETQLEGAALRRLARALTVQLPEIEIHDFRASGYLPEVVLNFIALMGWSPGEDREKMSMAEMCAMFSLERVGKTNARFDRAKLLNFNTTALAAADVERKLVSLRDYLRVSDAGPLSGLDDATLRRLIEICPGIRVIRDIELKAAGLFTPTEQIRYDAGAVEKVLRKNDGAGLKTLRELATVLDGVSATDWKTATLDAAVRGWGEQRGMKLGDVAQPIRVAITGNTISPPLFESLELMGKERTMGRVRRAVKEIGG